MTEEKSSLGLEDSEVFEAISHPLRIKILKILAKRPLNFSELKRETNVESNGALDFHLKKMRSLVVTDSTGRYTLNNRGYAALEAIRTTEQYGWQRRSFLLNLLVYLVVNIWAVMSFALSSKFLMVFAISTLWIIFYTYWTFVHRHVSLIKT